MSGGHFDYNQYKIGYIADEIEKIIAKNGREKTKEELKDTYHDAEWFKRYPEDLYQYKYPDEIIVKFQEAVITLRKAEIYAQRIDWLLSNDDGEETFLRRLEKELNDLTLER